MGDPGTDTPNPSLMGQELETVHLPVFAKFKDHCSEKRTNTALFLLETLRECHPNDHITIIAAQTCDLLGFAGAGHMLAHLDTSSNSFISQKTYKAPTSRVSGGEGKLSDGVTFGFYHGEWQGQQYPFYKVCWSDPGVGHVMNYYLLSPLRPVTPGQSDCTADQLLLAASQWTKDLHSEIYVFDNGGWSKNHKLWAAVQHASWDDVILDPAMKETLIADVRSFFDSRGVYEEYSVPWKRGIIFHGTPGCGKTISIKALMNSLQAKDVASLYVKSFEGCQGRQNSIRTIFNQARAMAPCLLIFEDLDSLVKDEVRSYFLNEVDGLEENDGILMIGSTNHLARLDPGISKRPSRFDRKYHFRLPGENERRLYCQYWKGKLQANSNIDFNDDVCDVVAKLTDGFSFAYMKELFVQTLLAIVGGRADDDAAENGVDEADLEVAAEKSRVVEGSTRLVSEDEQIDSATTDADGEKDEAKMASISETDRRLPDVEVPEHRQANPLLQILRKQITALVKEMDNTKDEVGSSKPKIPK